MNQYKRPEKELDPAKKPGQIIYRPPSHGNPLRQCPECGSRGFEISRLGPHRCEFCDGTVGGNPPLGPDTLQHNIEEYKRYDKETDPAKLTDQIVNFEKPLEKAIEEYELEGKLQQEWERWIVQHPEYNLPKRK